MQCCAVECSGVQCAVSVRSASEAECSTSTGSTRRRSNVPSASPSRPAAPHSHSRDESTRLRPRAPLRSASLRSARQCVRCVCARGEKRRGEETWRRPRPAQQSHFHSKSHSQCHCQAIPHWQSARAVCACAHVSRSHSRADSDCRGTCTRTSSSETALRQARLTAERSGHYGGGARRAASRPLGFTRRHTHSTAHEIRCENECTRRRQCGTT